MEFCDIVKGQKYPKKLNDKQMEILIKATCQQPADREASIIKMVEESKYSENQMVKQEYGMTISEECATVNARVLPAPKLKYGGEREVFPQVGQWKMANMKMYRGATVRMWTCLNFSQLDRSFVVNFCKDLATTCCVKGMNFSERPCVPIGSLGQRSIEETLLEMQNHQLQLLIIILSDVTGYYGKIKRICETKLGIVSQCCRPMKLIDTERRQQYLANIALKINVKAGGTNAVLQDAVPENIPLLTDRPTAIFSADVTHAQPGEESSASIAAVVCLMDWPEVTKYRGVVRAQSHRVEIIQDMCACVRELLIAFIKTNNRQPYRIIFYRDGVSEGQFAKVLSDEVNMIREACKSIDEKFQPPITFVVVQKRHHTRLFPVDPTMMDARSKNILPGTVVDSDICNPSEFDFYLCSHAGIQGTIRPTHYHVLCDENNFTADLLQLLTYSLCYTFARCTRSVSVVPPVYYAHLLAFRARYYVKGMSDGGSSSANNMTKDKQAAMPTLPEVMDNVKTVMFYC